ncbi:MAG: nitroreductase family protein [Proteobacteria bacterium]|nr:nitroreductase family protein [Desulfobacteraceae bacterium]MBU3980232.1 nitroreductase family protein [Pseudomonadota bacterium]MBU4014555.1 nitroreductase family protein [Pseudomonadota bacterium]MBU4068383.1 nitroreductase family protein [Pseudomonadota bacterium]MBU4101149.1 nitroreductase family protein [Pseudomonadota bacterium]
MIADLIKKNRTCRRFYQNHAVDNGTLKEIVDLARLSASAGNLQPLTYIISSNPELNARIFSCLGWAGYLKDWPGPEEGEKPSAYIIILGDTERAKKFGCDHGIASQSILLGAREKDLAGCIIGSVNRKKLRDIFNIDSRYKILLVLAIGKPKEKVVIEKVISDDKSSTGRADNIKYWRDENGVHHVPKRSLDDIILSCY